MIGVFALSAALKDSDIEKYKASTALLEKQGFKFTLANNLEDKEEIFNGADYFSAGTTVSRLKALQALKTSTYLSLKGGYGVQQCLASLDSSIFKDSSVFGYSDLTALFCKLQVDDSIKLYHSPMLVELSSLSEEELESFKAFLGASDDVKTMLLKFTTGLKDKLEQANSCFLQAPSYIWGGNLTLLLSVNIKPTIKSGYKNILFIEDCFEEAYKLERMLYTAQSLNLYQDIDELWLGESKEALFNLDLLKEFSKKYNFNLVTELPFGHNKKFTLPIFRHYN